MNRSRSPRTDDTPPWLDALPLLVIAADAVGRVHFANVAAAEALAGRVGGLVGRRLADIFGPESLPASLARRATAERVALTHSDIQIDGPMFSLGRADVIVAPVDDPVGAVLTFVPRALLRGAPPTTIAPPIARTLAHEVRNPLAGIRAAAQLIGKGAPAETRVLTDLICAETDRIRRLTDRIDALDGLAPPQLALMNIHEALERAHAVIAASFPHVAVEEAYDPSLPPVNGDMDQLIQVFLNIAKNAAEALRGIPESRITLATRFRPGVHVRRAGGAARSQMEIAIADNGPGIAAAVRGKLFEPFATTKQDGAGLGLAIAAEIVARHDGRIDVDSRPGATVFRIQLPVAEEARP